MNVDDVQSVLEQAGALIADGDPSAALEGLLAEMSDSPLSEAP